MRTEASRAAPSRQAMKHEAADPPRTARRNGRGRRYLMGRHHEHAQRHSSVSGVIRQLLLTRVMTAQRDNNHCCAVLLTHSKGVLGSFSSSSMRRCFSVHSA